MSSAENGRLVWISSNERRKLGDFFASNSGVDVIGDVLNRWDAAPVDPAEAIAVALAFGSATPEWQERTWCEHATAVLAALGVPQRPTPRDETPS